MARGNPVMKAKRVTGPSPDAVLKLKVKLERCSVKGCDNKPLRSTTTDGTIKRECAAHILTPEQRTAANGVSAITPGKGWRPAWMG